MNAMHILAVTASVLALTVPAFAAEGNGDPFPGPNAAVSEPVTPHPHYTMGGDAPFNYFYTPTPTQMTNYKQGAGSADDPYPLKMSGQTIQLQPSPTPNLYAHSPQPGTHG